MSDPKDRKPPPRPDDVADPVEEPPEDPNVDAGDDEAIDRAIDEAIERARQQGELSDADGDALIDEIRASLKGLGPFGDDDDDDEGADEDAAPADEASDEPDGGDSADGTSATEPATDLPIAPSGGVKIRLPPGTKLKTVPLEDLAGHPAKLTPTAEEIAALRERVIALWGEDGSQSFGADVEIDAETEGRAPQPWAEHEAPGPDLELSPAPEVDPLPSLWGDGPPFAWELPPAPARPSLPAGWVRPRGQSAAPPRKIPWRSQGRVLRPDLGPTLIVADSCSERSSLCVAAFGWRGARWLWIRMTDDGPEIAVPAANDEPEIELCVRAGERVLEGVVRLVVVVGERGVRLGRDQLAGRFVIDPARETWEDED